MMTDCGVDGWVGRRALPFALGGPTCLTLSRSLLPDRWRTASRQLGGPTCLTLRSWWADAPHLELVSLCRSFGIRVDSWAGRRARPPLLVGRRASPEWVALSQALETAVGPTCLGLRPWWADAPHLGLVSLCRSLGIRVDSWAGRRARPSLLAGADVLRLGLAFPDSAWRPTVLRTAEVASSGGEISLRPQRLC